jgi:diguanylate cyclase (GGDEF)-like protein/PAS domain S-box-containing protein
MLVLSADAAFSEAIATCCCTLGLSVRHVRDTRAAVDALAQGAAEMVIIDGDLDFVHLADFVTRMRLTLCADWVPLIVAGDPERLRPRLRQAAPGMVDRVIGKPLAHEELHESLAAARRAVSLRRAFDSTLDRVSEAVIVIDESGLIRAFNAAAQRLFQWQHGEVLGSSVNRLMPDRHLQQHDGYIARYQSTGQAQVIGKGRIESGQRRDGSQFPMHLTVSDISDAYGTRFVGVIRDLTRDREAEDLRQRALHDALTGLPNHAYAQEQLRAACKSATDRGDGFAVLYLDLDRFKPVNDEHGHAVGDQVLKTVAHRLRHSLDKDDIVARMGGDEFLVLLRRISRSTTAEAVVRRLHDSVARPIVVGAHTLTVGMSTGIAVHGTDGTTAESLLNAADQAMYARKRLGRASMYSMGSGPLSR